MPQKYAILMDGGFVKKKLKAAKKAFPTVADIVAECERIKQHPALGGMSLLRTYFYDAPPATGILRNPIDGSRVDLSASPEHAQNVSLQQTLELQPDFALREG